MTGTHDPAPGPDVFVLKRTDYVPADEAESIMAGFVAGMRAATHGRPMLVLCRGITGNRAMATDAARALVDVSTQVDVARNRVLLMLREHTIPRVGTNAGADMREALMAAAQAAYTPDAASTAEAAAHLVKAMRSGHYKPETVVAQVSPPVAAALLRTPAGADLAVATTPHDRARNVVSLMLREHAHGKFVQGHGGTLDVEAWVDDYNQGVVDWQRWAENWTATLPLTTDGDTDGLPRTVNLTVHGPPKPERRLTKWARIVLATWWVACAVPLALLIIHPDVSTPITVGVAVLAITTRLVIDWQLDAPRRGRPEE